MRNKEITLIDLPSRTGSLMSHGYQVSNYRKLNHILKSIEYRIENNFQLPDFILINNRKIDSSEFEYFNEALKKLNIKIPNIVFDEAPARNKMKTYRDMGVGDYLGIEVSDNIVIRQLKRLEYSNALNNATAKKRPFVSFDKRAFDIFFSLIILILISPILLTVMLAIRLESKGPVFYWQPRVGTGYKVFNFYKFRSMRVDADQMLDNVSKLNHYDQKEEVTKKSIKESSSNMLVGDDRLIHEENFIQDQLESTDKSFKKFENDPRITKVGHWIRKTSIDELPQLINVLIGDMSLVGNRPLPLYEAETLTIDAWAERFMAPAGITGLWQVTERGKKATSTDSRKQLDNEYARKHNLLMDLKILIKTPLAAIQQENV
ncbi:MAG: lipopolysaccharide/colanic/teichoic acid biosynthesis glycosyltransferase [Cyclobacteriaceae bacterium]|jgi:lipopolysaccharide/colanic/teichoic acid biosynthesis glycosyltransferase